MSEKLYNNRFLIAIYEVDLSTYEELNLLTIEDNIKGLLEYFKIPIQENEERKMKDIIYRALHVNTKRKGMILIKGEMFKIALIPQKPVRTKSRKGDRNVRKTR